jgi:hypothetical protein
MILLKMFSSPLTWDSSPYSIPTIFRFDIFIVSWMFVLGFYTLFFFFFFFFLSVVSISSMVSSTHERSLLYPLYSVGDTCICSF